MIRGATLSAAAARLAWSHGPGAFPAAGFAAVAIPLALASAVLVPASPLAGQVSAGGVGIELTGRAQIQFSTTSLDPHLTPVAGSMFETRRIRFGARLRFNEWLRAEIVPDWSLDEVSLSTAFLEADLTSGSTLRIGQFKKPFGLLERTSSTVFPTIERGVRIRGLDAHLARSTAVPVIPPPPGFGGAPLTGEEYALLSRFGYSGYDIGASVRGTAGRLSAEAGVFNGNGRDRADTNDGKSAAGMLRLSPLAGVPLTLGTAASYSERRSLEDPAEDFSGTAYEVDAEWGAFRRPGIHLMLEVASGEVPGTNDHFLGAQGIAAYFQPLSGERFDGVEPVFRVSHGDPRRDLEDDEGLLITPGVNIYAFGRNRLQLNWDFYIPAADDLDAAHAARAMAQVYF